MTDSRSRVSTVAAEIDITSDSDIDIIIDLRDGAHVAVVQPTGRESVPPEPVRDRALGPLTTHRIQAVFSLTFGMAALFLLQDWIWSSVTRPVTWYDEVWSWGSLLWLTALIPSACGFVGILWYRFAPDLDEVAPVTSLVVFRIVSRGTNRQALEATVKRCHAEMVRSPLFPYVVEVVTDHPSGNHLDLPNAVQLEVPDDYRTANGALFKARGLQYALEHSAMPDDAWLVHLDEETQPTPSGIKGIARLITEEEASGELRVGQGAILYHRNWRQHPFLTLADMVRTGDDFARFHFQHRVGVTLFGLHGSYIVCRNDVEKEVGFDFGPVGSITEDAFWALKCMENGRRARWCDGYLEEQSTESVMDFIKQRRRWFMGLAMVSLHAPVHWKWRIMLGFNTFTWAFAPLALLYTYIHFAYGFEVRGWIRWGANFAFASFVTFYITGLRDNLAEYGITNPIEKAGWYVAQIALMPVFSLMESVSVAFAIVRPSMGFHVVKK